MLIEINAENPEPRKIRRVVDALERGEVIAYPTDTCYGLGCDLFNKKAIERLYQIKGMSEETARKSIDWLHSIGCRVLPSAVRQTGLRLERQEQI